MEKLIINTTYCQQLIADTKKEYRIDVKLFRLFNLFAEEYKRIHNENECNIDGVFYPYKGSSCDIGRIKICEEKMSVEVVIHECAHAAIEYNRKRGRIISNRYEEKIVKSIGQLAAAVLSDLYVIERKKGGILGMEQYGKEEDKEEDNRSE